MRRWLDYAGSLRSILSLEKQNLLISKNLNSNSFDKIKWYTINYDALKTLENSLALSSPSNRSNRADQNDTTIRSKRSDRGSLNDLPKRSNRSDDKIKMISSNIETETTTETTTKTISLNNTYDNFNQIERDD